MIQSQIILSVILPGILLNHFTIPFVLIFYRGAMVKITFDKLSAQQFYFSISKYIIILHYIYI